MARIEIAELEIDERATEKLWAHQVLPRQLRAVIAGFYIVTRNRKGRAASHLLIGRDDQGKCLTAPVVRTHDPLVWSVITAWECKPGEAAKLRR
jgi:hypothetical protein